MNNWEKGQRAEAEAARFLRACGYRIWKQNWRSGRKEIDLVAIDGDTLVFVEVKSMMGNQVNQPAVVIGRRKQQNMVWAASSFIRAHHSKRPTRFDVVAVSYTEQGPLMQLTREAFVPLAE